ncbi:redoxin domain-containing protein [Candidatus Woesearchaeota archaeon]|nr:redoxin domain-containing protein [Candidatus Woesearchaeota archaeon]
MKKNVVLAVVLISIVVFILYLEEPRTAVQRVSPVVNKAGIPAPELQGIAGYINTENITLKDLVGKKVVLVDIWTYSCINCQRTLPYLTAWYDRYKDKGFEIIGVHSPEFAFERKVENVQRAVDKFGIKYPVVLDNDHQTWRAFRNNYWPRKYLIDIDGYIVHDHIGEGGYEETERRIQEALAERSARLGLAEVMPSELSSVNATMVDAGRIGTPEIYLGYGFTRGNFGNPEGLPAEQEVVYSLPKEFDHNRVYLEGKWFVDGDHVRLVGDKGKVVLKFAARNANIVASGKSLLSVKLDGVQKKNVSVSTDDLYSVVMEDDYATRTVELAVSGSGFALYTFTFG